MADVKWIKIVTDVFDDEKILMIETMPECDTIIVIWFKLLCLAGKQNNGGVFQMGQMPYTDEMFAAIFRRPINTVRMALTTFERFGMIEIIRDTVTIPNWGKHQSLDAYEKKKLRDRERVARKRAEQKALIAMSPDMSPDRSLDVASLEEDKDIDRDIEKDNKSVRETTHTLFNRLILDYAMSLPQHKAVAEKLVEWIKYKTERKEPYKEQGMKTLLRQIENNCFAYGDQAVCDLIDDSMANGWKGIIFDRLKKQQTAQPRPSQQPRRNGNVFLDMLGDDDL